MFVSALVAMENICQKQLEGGRVLIFCFCFFPHSLKGYSPTREVRDEVAAYFVSMVVKEQRALSIDSELFLPFIPSWSPACGMVRPTFMASLPYSVKSSWKCSCR